MIYGYTIIYVKDVNETISFYENAFGFQRGFITPESDYGELLTGNTTLAFATLKLGHSNLPKGFVKSHREDKPFGVELAFVSENIEADYKTAIENGAIEYQAISAKPWGQKVGYLRDINGFLIEICSPMNVG